VKNSLTLLGFNISDGDLKPDPQRVKPVLEMPVPTSPKQLQRVVGMFAYYAQWITQCSEKSKPLISATEFPLGEKLLHALQALKEDLSSATLRVIDENHLPLVGETDASENAISASLNQGNRPVAFFSRMLNKCELRQSSVEKEASAIAEAVRKWTHYLLGRKFTIVSDQRPVTFMYNVKHVSKIKNASNALAFALK